MLANLDYPNGKGFVSGWEEHLQESQAFSCVCVQHEKLPSAMELLYLDMISHTRVRQVSAIEQAPIIFGFHIAGSSRSDIIYSALRKESITAGANKVLIGFTPFSSCETLFGKEQRYRFFNIYISPEQLYEQLGHSTNVVPDTLQRIIKGSVTSSCSIIYPMSPQTRMIIDQLRNCPYQGDLKALFLEHKSMELILRQFYELQHTARSDSELRRHTCDVDLIHNAQKVLFDNIDNPPTLTDLAQQVGTNPTTLKKGFRQVFDTTAYAMVRQERIRRACAFLDRGDLSVAEIGHRLGFSDTSHFIRVFAKHYGVTPGKYARGSDL